MRLKITNPKEFVALFKIYSLYTDHKGLNSLNSFISDFNKHTAHLVTSVQLREEYDILSSTIVKKITFEK